MRKQIKIINNFELNKHLKSYYLNFYISGVLNIYNIEEFKKITKSKLIDTNKILIEAYVNFGVNIFKYLKGDWIIILYNTKNDKLIVIKDQSSHTPFFYYYDNNVFIGAYFLKDIIKSKYFKLVLNKNMLLNELLRIHLDNETAYKNTYLLKCNTYLEVVQNGVKVNKYEMLKYNILSYKNENDYYEHFDELFTNAVKRRIKPNLGIFLSSGLDSTSILVKTLENTNEKISTYTSIPKYNVYVKNRNGNEKELVKLLINKYKGRINPNFINSYNTNFIESLNLSLDIHPEPMPWAINFYWINDLYKKAKNDNVKTILNGGIGNLTISKTFNKKYFYHRSNIYFKYKTFKIKRQHIFNNYLRLNSKINLLLKLFFFQKDYINTLSINNIYGMRAMSIANFYNIKKFSPANDIDIVNFFSSIPNNFFIDSIYGNRPFVIYSMQNKIPNDILYYKKRGLQASDIILRLEDEKKHLEKIFITAVNNKNIKYFFNKKRISLLKKYPRLILFLLFLLKNEEYEMD